MTSKSLSENPEILDLMRFQNIEYYQVSLTGKDLKGKNYSFTVKEIWKGKVKNTDTIFNSTGKEVSFLGGIDSDTLKFSVTASKLSKKELRMNFSFKRFGLDRTYKSTTSDSYSLRDIGTQMVIEPGKPFYAFAYILPAPQGNGSSSWCAVDSSGKDIEKWGQEFGLKHYLLVEMNIFE